jgi:tetratricopeptide (TPR) repeat protein
MSKLDFPPAKHEVENQLQRMLASPRFRNAENPSDFLRLGVERALEGNKTTGHVIADGLFKGKFIQGESADVRVTAGNLRKTLAKYYASEGSNDFVIISLPKPAQDKSIRPVEGEAYTPQFSYNPRHETQIFLRIAFRSLEQSTYSDFDRASRIFADILGRDPENLGATLGMVEMCCKCADRRWENPDGAGPSACKNVLANLEKRADSYWRFWAVRAYLYKGEEKNELSSSFYEKALALDRQSTESYLPYIEFLVDTGRTDEAMVLAQAYMNDRIEDSTAVAQYGQILLSVGRGESGLNHVQTSLTMDPGNILAHETMAAVRLTQRDLKSLAVHLLALKALCDARSFERIAKFLTDAEEQYDLKGSIAKLLLGTNGDSEPIVKP